VLLFVLLASTFLTACGPPQTVVVTVPPAQQTVVAQQTVIVQPTAVPATPVPVVDRKGAWLDSIILVEEPNAAAAVTRMQSGELDMYAYGVSDPELFKRVKESSDLAYSMAYGNYTELTFNPAGPVFSTTQKLNPFADPKMREAINYLVDRDYIAQEIYGGLAIARYTCMNTAAPDFANMADLMRAVSLKYAYNPEKAKEIINTQMTALGATLTGDKWTYNGEPVTIIVLIRIEDQRKAIGDYISSQLETVGFTVDRQYKARADAGPIWQGDPNSGLWHIYTGGWVTTAIARDLGSNFGYFYTPLGSSGPLWQAYKNDPAFYTIAEKLWINDFKTIAERTELFRQALDLSMQDSYRVWLVDQVAFAPYRSDVTVAADLSGGINGSALWALTIRRIGQIGGVMTVAQPAMTSDPWNGVAGSNWVYDAMPKNATASAGTVPDPYTGLSLPQRIEKAEVVVQQDLPVGKTLDWLTLSTAPSIEVPADAWIDWDPVNQKFITVGEKYTQTQTALTKSTVYYPADMYQTVKWHDGSAISAADFVMRMIFIYDQGYTQSAIYDEAAVPNLEAWKSHFKGVKIVSTNPLVIETYDDLWLLDAENIVTSWWPNYGYGEQPWHTMALGVKAETDKKLALSQDKATVLGVEWMSFLAGPSIDILNTYLVTATNELYVPYAATLGQFVAADEAATRYTNLAEWVRTTGHFWVGTGPFYLQRAFPVERTMVLKRFQQYPDLAAKWDRFSEPRLATVEVTGPSSVTIGKEAAFDVLITFKDQPYAVADVVQVKYLVLDATGQIAATGVAEAVADGQWKVTLAADVTSKLAAGSNRLEIAVVPKVVALPAFGSVQFVTAP
jgi:peptide/nickel transport system substrate-binding protein